MHKIRLDLRRVAVDRDDKRVIKKAVMDTSPPGLRPWREVLAPHEDVATGNFRASEFAADLFKVATRSGDTAGTTADPVQFFNRTYLTEGLRDLMGERSAGSRRPERLAGHQPADQLRWRQDALDARAVASRRGHAARDFPQGVQDLLKLTGTETSPQAKAGRDGRQPLAARARTDGDSGEHDVGRAGLAARRQRRLSRSWRQPTQTATPRGRHCRTT